MSGVEKAGAAADAAEIEALIREFEASDVVDLQVRTASFEIVLSKNPDFRKVSAATGTPGERRASARSGLRPAPAGAAASRPPDVAAPSAAPAASAAPTEPPNGWHAVRAPYKGTFYRAPKPGEPAFVEIGDRVKAGADLCLVEVMKLFTAVRTGQGGVVREIYAVDGQMVDEGRLLFAIDPEG